MVIERAATAEGSAAEDGLDELVLAEGFGKVVLTTSVCLCMMIQKGTYVHLRRETLLAVAHHGVGGKSNDWC